MVVVGILIGIAVVALLAGVHWYVWRRLVRDTTAAGSRLRRAGTATLVALPLLMVGALVSGRAGAPFWFQQVVSWPGYLWLAVLLYLTLALLVGEAVRPLLRRLLERRDARAGSSAEPVRADPGVADAGTGTDTDVGASTGTGNGATTDTDVRTPAPPAAPPAQGPSRRLFVSRVVGGAAAAAALGTVGYGTYGVLRGPRVKRVTVPLAKLARSAHGFRIAVVSDVHLGPILGRAHTQRIVDTINATQPDLVAVVGDLVDGSVADLGSAAEPLARLKSRHGTYFVTGNHEYFSGAGEWIEHVRELGMRPLENERVEIAGFDLAGVNDIAGESEGQGPDFVRALGDRDRSRASVLLAHQPVVIHDAVRHGVDLQLSGHTHGGQLWPFG
ncbi:MAG TPA: metallophosphoesterase, partial [Streptomyces sp.]|nr:metallophosphoesterase [Streptomyces sp.]